MKKRSSYVDFIDQDAKRSKSSAAQKWKGKRKTDVSKSTVESKLVLSGKLSASLSARWDSADYQYVGLTWVMVLSC